VAVEVVGPGDACLGLDGDGSLHRDTRAQSCCVTVERTASLDQKRAFQSAPRELVQSTIRDFIPLTSELVNGERSDLRIRERLVQDIQDASTLV
jgi:hypothetical protein